jgi:glycosyltransferase involved in cell wall biosynthesis
MSDAPGSRPEPLVAVVIPALNEAGKIGNVLGKLPADGRFEAIVVDDGSSDETSEVARAAGAAVVLRHPERQGKGVALRDGWEEGIRRGRPYLAIVDADGQHEAGELAGALDHLLHAKADYLQGSRWMKGGRVVGPTGPRGMGTRLYSVLFSILAFRRMTDATNGFRIFRSAILRDPRINLDQAWLTSYDLEPYLLFRVIQGPYKLIEHPVTVIYHEQGYTKMQGVRDWWRLFRPAVLLRFHLKS